MLGKWLTPVLLLLALASTDGLFTKKFRHFLKKKYGANVEASLTREDMGPGGSYGGGLDHVAGRPTNKRPVIIVHGLANTASTFSATQQYFLAHGYTDREVYGTTYGDGGQTAVIFVPMRCDYIKSIRYLIRAVAKYANSRVNMIVYSMGSPIARKAIKGGVCVDTGEDLGPPLTGFVYTFVSVAGANFGSFLCQFSVGTCNTVNGLGCGSKFLTDINGAAHYEGSFVYTIFSTGDDRVGYTACGNIASSITNEDRRFVKSGLTHNQVMFDTLPLQYNLISKNSE